MTTSASDLDVLIRLSVLHADRRIDLAIPGRIALVEVLPGIARGLGVLDPTLLHGGYRLARADGSELDPARGAIEQGVDQGEVLTLTRGVLVSAPKRYDDIVEAIVDATESRRGQWRPEDAARTASAISFTLLSLCAILLASLGPADTVAAIIAGGSAVVLLALAATLSRMRQHPTGIGFGIAAAAFAALCGYLLVPASDFWGFPLAAAGGGAAAAAGLAMLLCRKPIELLALPIALGAALSAPALVTALTDVGAPAAYSLMVAVCGLLAGALPWLTFTSTRITAVSPQTETEMFDPPPPIDPERVAARADAGARLLVALRVAFALAVLAATPLVAASSWIGVILTTLTGATLMFQSRQSAARASVLVLLAGGTAIIALSGLVAVFAHPEQAPILLVALLVATGLVTGLTLLSDRVRLSLSTTGDTIEVLILALLLPLGVISAGLV